MSNFSISKRNSTFFSNYTFIERDILCFCQDVFKVVCCIFIVCGKGLNLSYIHESYSRWLWKHLSKNMINSLWTKVDHRSEFKTLWQKEKLFIISSFFFCPNIFKHNSCSCIRMCLHAGNICSSPLTLWKILICCRCESGAWLVAKFWRSISCDVT